MNLERLKQEEDEVAKVIENWTRRKRLIAYKCLYAMDLRISNIDYEIIRSLREEEKQP